MLERELNSSTQNVVLALLFPGPSAMDINSLERNAEREKNDGICALTAQWCRGPLRASGHLPMGTRETETALNHR